MAKNAYPCRMQNGEHELVLLWVDGDGKSDCFLTTASGDLLVYDTVEELCSCKPQFGGLLVHYNNISLLDLQLFWKILASMRVEHASSMSACNVLLEAWNAFEDLSRSLCVNLRELLCFQEDMQTIYDRLISGCNLPALTLDREFYSATWAKSDIIKFHAAMHEIWMILLGRAPRLARLAPRQWYRSNSSRMRNKIGQ